MQPHPQRHPAAERSAPIGERPTRERTARGGVRPSPAAMVVLMLLPFLAWQAVRVNLADHFAAEPAPEASRRSLSWNAGQPDALRAQAMRLPIAGDTANPTLLQAVMANPTDGRLFAALALQAEAAKAPELARQSMDAAIGLAPQRTDVQLAAYRFWLRQNDPARALRHVSTALTRDGAELKPALYPELVELMRHPKADEAYFNLLRQPVPWWPDFFNYVSQRTNDVNVLRVLHSMQKQGPNPPGDQELKSLIGRLQQDDLWDDAYLTWLNSVPRENLVFNGEIYNGGFELDGRDFGFEWINTPLNGVLVGFDPTYGTSGSRALHVVFQGLRARWQHFHQYVLLQPGEYSLRGRVRIDSLKAAEGVRWSLTCLGRPEPQAVTERFKGTDQWRHFQVPFSVPEDCPVQELRLGLVGRSALDFVADGQVWFDEIAVHRQP